MAFCRQRR